MKKLVFAVLALGALALGFSLVFLSSSVSSEDEPTGGAVEPRSADSAESGETGDEGRTELVFEADGTGETEGELVAAPNTDAGSRAVVESLDEARTVGEWASSEKRLVRGRILLPAGLTEDPTLSVAAFRSLPTQSDVYGRFGALSKFDRERRGIDAESEDAEAQAEEDGGEVEADELEPIRSDAPEDPFAATEAAETRKKVTTVSFGGTSTEEDEASRIESRAQEEHEIVARLEMGGTALRGMIAIAPAQPDGSFEIPFPADLETGWLVIDGRYLFSDGPVTVDLTEDAIVDLEPVVGAWVTGEVFVPADLEDREATLRDLRVTLEYDPSQFNFLDVDFTDLFARQAVPDGTGRFEFRGVPTGPPYVVTASSDDLADTTKSGIEVADGRDEHVELTMVHGARVTGRVVDESGTPVAEARVRAATGSLFGFATNGVGHTRSDEEGWFEFPHLPPGKVQLNARLSGYLDSAPFNLELVDLEVRDGIEVKLSSGAQVSGIVRLPDGSPAVGVEVELDFDPDALASMAAFNAARGADGEAVTGEDGRFVIGGLGKGPFEVSAAMEINGQGHAARVAPVQPGDDDIELDLRPDPVIAGTVTTADGMPIPEFVVRAELDSVAFWMGGDAVEESFESEDGSFRLDGLSEGSWKVRASAENWASSEWITLELPLAEGAEPITLVVLPEAIAEGVVLDPDGNPIAGATVHQQLDLMQTIADATGQDRPDSARTDEEGKFRLGGLGEGSISLLASHGDHVDSETAAIQVVAGRTTSEIVLQLRVGGVITGEIFNEDGDPASGAMIVIQDTTNFLPTMMRSEPDGTFRRESVKPGKYQVTAMVGDLDATTMFSEDSDEPDFTSFLGGMKTDVAEVKEGETTHVILGAPPSDPVHLSGTVRHLDDPIAKAIVTLFPEGGTGLGSMKFTSTNAEGQYEVTLDKPGNYLMQVQILKGSSMMEQDTHEYRQSVPEGVESHVIDVSLPTGKVSGRIYGPDGEPVTDLRVTLTVSGGVGYGSFLGERYVETRTNGEGVYEVNYLSPNVYSVLAGGTVLGGAFGGSTEAGRMVRTGIHLGEGEWIQDVDFRLKRPGEITGRVLDVTGQAVKDAAIFVRDESGHILERFSMCSSDGAGKFRYAGVAPGKYTVSARTSELSSIESNTIVVPEGGSGDTIITVEAATILKVSVVDKTGDEVKARILVNDEDGRQVNGMLSYAEIVSNTSRLYSTEAQEVGPLAPGRYIVTAMAEDGRTVTKPVTLTGQKERRLKIRLK